MDGVKTYEDGIACAFDLLKVAACNTDDERRSEILEEAAEDIIELAPTYKREWKDLTAALAELATLREELATSNKVGTAIGETLGRVTAERDDLHKCLTAAEQRNAELEEIAKLLRHQLSAASLELRRASSWICREVEAGTTSATHWAIRLRTNANQIDADLKPTESGASE